MGSTIIPIVANLFMEECEVKSINSAPHPPRSWLRCMDDTFVMQKAEHINKSLQYINTIYPHIQFTQEATAPSGLHPLSGHLVTPGPDNALCITVYRRPTHRDQYLHMDNHHSLSAKYRVFNILLHRPRQFALPPSCSSRRRNIPKRLNPGAVTPLGS